MSEQTAIQWTDKTWNPWHGCRKVSDGCKFCYMYRDKERYGQDPLAVVRSKTTFNAPNRWAEPAKVFTCSWSDFFIEDADEWRPEAWSLIKTNSHLTFQILTKRPENIADRLPPNWGSGYPNVWLGVSVENNKEGWRLDALRELRARASKLFVSFEPLLEQLDVDILGYDWAIIGGESGNETGKYLYRPCKLQWIESLIRTCRLYDVAPFVKQLGTFLGKKHNLKDSHGGNIDEFPEYLKIREFPA